MRRSAAVALLVLAFPLGTALAGCTGDSADQPAADVTATPTPLSGFDTGAVTVARADFCGLVPESAAEHALGGPVDSTSDYGNGQRATIAPDVHDVAHEFSCTWTGADGSTARAWVFAPQVTTRQAKSMVRDLRHEKGCRTPPAPAFGEPSVALLCTSAAGTEASYHGLFVDAWLSCSLSAGPGSTEADLLARAGEWCVQVASAADTGLG